MSDSAVLGGPALMAEAVANKTKRKRRMWLDYSPSATITIIHLELGAWPTTSGGVASKETPLRRHHRSLERLELGGALHMNNPNKTYLAEF